MKKTISTLTIIILPAIAFAQGGIDPAARFQTHVFDVISLIFTLALFMGFFLSIMKRIFDHRLKKLIVDKGVPENVIPSIIQNRSEENENVNIKWFAILAGLGLGFLLIKFTLPLGIHSLAILAFCLSASFLGYYFFLKREGENKMSDK